MKITILCVGKIKEKYMINAIEDYEKRLSHYCKMEIIEVNEEYTIEKEAACLIKRIPNGSMVIALDLQGIKITSQGLAEYIEKSAVEGTSAFTFIIGGSLGLDKTILQKSYMSLCLSDMTFTHQMARLFILEQLYRAMKINSGETYHK